MTKEIPDALVACYDEKQSYNFLVLLLTVLRITCKIFVKTYSLFKG